MAITNRQFEDLAYLAELLEDSSNFKIDLDQFVELANYLKSALEYQYFDDREIQQQLAQIPKWDPFPEEEGFLQKLLPRSQRKMVDKYKHKQKILDQVKLIDRVMYNIHLRIREELP